METNSLQTVEFQKHQEARKKQIVEDLKDFLAVQAVNKSLTPEDWPM